MSRALSAADTARAITAAQADAERHASRDLLDLASRIDRLPRFVDEADAIVLLTHAADHLRVGPLADVLADLVAQIDESVLDLQQRTEDGAAQAAALAIEAARERGADLKARAREGAWA